ncbi:hypothetical protein FQN52_003610 [Onygenales sp. PD_12]|nr:hypothetical protein FQN52_003610 [Onygenales sp. PD_12]
MRSPPQPPYFDFIRTIRPTLSRHSRPAWSKPPDPGPPANAAEARSSDASGMMLCSNVTDALGPEHYAQFQPPAQWVDRHVGAARTMVIKAMITQTIRRWLRAV